VNGPARSLQGRCRQHLRGGDALPQTRIAGNLYRRRQVRSDPSIGRESPRRLTHSVPLRTRSAHLFSQLVPSRFEPASRILTSNTPCGRGGETSPHDIVAAMIDGLLHHAEVVARKGDRRSTTSAGLRQPRPT